MSASAAGNGVAACPEKDPKRRLRDIGDAWRILDRDVGAAQTFFRRALQKQGDPLSITLDA
jgi:hypothetical protein